MASQINEDSSGPTAIIPRSARQMQMDTQLHAKLEMCKLPSVFEWLHCFFLIWAIWGVRGTRKDKDRNILAWIWCEKFGRNSLCSVKSLQSRMMRGNRSWDQDRIRISFHFLSKFIAFFVIKLRVSNMIVSFHAKGNVKATYESIAHNRKDLGTVHCNVLIIQAVVKYTRNNTCIIQFVKCTRERSLNKITDIGTENQTGWKSGIVLRLHLYRSVCSRT